MPVERGRRYKPWHCSICGRVYRRRDSTAREVLNAWWKHMKKYHPAEYAKKKKQQIQKSLATKRKKGIINKHSSKKKKRKKRK